MENLNKKGFTLVELIIVITILVILATIAFISFQSYSADTRDAKRKSDINNIVKSIELKLSQGVNLLSFVSGSGSRLANPNIAGSVSTGGINYEAGDVNLTIVGLGHEFKDGSNNYKIGVTTKANGAYQVVGKMESNITAFVKGTFNPRTSSGNGIGYFKVGDTLSGNVVVTKISSDLTTLTIGNSGTISATGANLAISDVLGLVRGINSTNSPVIDGGSILPY